MITQSFDPVSPEIVRTADTIRAEEKALAAPFPIHSFLIVFSGALIRLLSEGGLIVSPSVPPRSKIPSTG